MTRTQRDITLIAFVTLVLFYVAVTWSPLPLIGWIIAVVAERASYFANKSTPAATRTVKLPRALCMACNRTVATTERDGVQRYRVHFREASRNAPVCPRSRMIVGDDSATFKPEPQLVLAETDDGRVVEKPKPAPTFRPNDGSIPMAEPTADEQFGTSSKFPNRAGAPPAREMWLFSNGDVLTKDDPDFIDWKVRYGEPERVGEATRRPGA
jgi:hypothetical protein